MHSHDNRKVTKTVGGVIVDVAVRVGVYSFALCLIMMDFVIIFVYSLTYIFTKYNFCTYIDVNLIQANDLEVFPTEF